VDAPFVFAAQPGRRAIDQDLALPEPERAFVQKAAGEHLGKDARAPAMVRNKTSGGMPGGMMRASSAAIAGS
jgi:hypothetical protein